MAKEKRPTWWKMLYHQRAAIESVSDEDAGAGLKAAFRYFDGEDIPPESLSVQAFTVFCVVRPYIDDAWRDFEKSVETGKEGARRRWKKDRPPIGPLTTPIGVLREEEVEEDEEVEVEREEDRGADKPLPRSRFVPPTVEEVQAYIDEQGYTGVSAAAFVDYYTANGWVQGKGKPIKDWKAAVRTWARREKQLDPEPESRMELVTNEDGEQVWRMKA